MNHDERNHDERLKALARWLWPDLHPTDARRDKLRAEIEALRQSPSTTAIRMDITPAQVARLKAVGLVLGDGNLGEWLVLAAERLAMLEGVEKNPPAIGFGLCPGLLEPGWAVMGWMMANGEYTSITAATSDDGIGVVATWDWDRHDGVWRLMGWGCTQDNGPDRDGGDMPPDVPPWATENNNG